MLNQILFGFIVQTIASLDDTLTHVPITASVTKSRMGKLAFILGIFIGVSIAIIIAYHFAHFLAGFIYYRYIAAFLLFGLALAIHMDVFVHEPRKKQEQKIKHMTGKRFGTLTILGVVTALATGIDDVIAYIPLFLDSGFPFAIIGIFLAVLTELTLVFYFSKQISKLKWKDELASLGLFLLGLYVLIG